MFPKHFCIPKVFNKLIMLCYKMNHKNTNLLLTTCQGRTREILPQGLYKKWQRANIPQYGSSKLSVSKTVCILLYGNQAMLDYKIHSLC